MPSYDRLIWMWYSSELRGREVIRMRIERQHERVHERLEHILGLALIHALRDVLVALAQHVRDLGPLLARDDERQRVVLHALAPQLVHLRGVRGPRLFLAVEVEGFLDVEVGLFCSSSMA